MSTATIEGQSKNASLLFANGSLTSFDTQVKKRFFERDGVKILELDNLAVFRSGTFRDSMGFQHSYDEFHIEQFVVNFNHLRTSGVLPDVPVRKGHPSFGTNRMDGLIGYVTELRTEKRTSTSDKVERLYLLGKLEILDPEAQEKINSGLYRNRSAEVGTYVDNNEAEYAPTFMGVAYVDIPAVEGLNGFTKSLPTGSTSYMMEEDMTNSLPTPPAPAPTEATKEVPFAFSLSGVGATTDPVAVQAYITSLEAKSSNFEAEIQRRDAAEVTRKESEREEFVNGLIAEGKILAPAADAQRAFAKSLTDEQFSTWSGTFGAMPINPLLQEYGNQDGDSGKPDSAAVDVDTEVMRNMRYARVSDDVIMKTGHYAQVIKKDPNFQLSDLDS